MMELNQQDIQLIERYLDGALDEKGHKNFAQRQADDTTFNKAVLSYEEAVLAVKLANEDRIETIIKEERTKLKQAHPLTVVSEGEKKIKSPLILRGALAAASIAALLIIGYWFLTKDTIKPLSPLVAANFEPYPALGITRGESDKTIKDEALRTYAVNDFKKAIPQLQKAFDIDRDTMFLFYKAIAHLGANEPNNAVTIFTGLQNKEVLPSEMIEWYLALAYIELGQIENALPLLQKVGNIEGENREKAVVLLEKLK